MKEIIKFPVIIILLFCVKIFYHMGCAASQPLNDYFGIEMAEEDADQFRIVSYEKDRGANYYSNSRMNPQLYAWAEIEPEIIRIKVVNLTDSNVFFNYNTDQFTVITDDEKEFSLSKRDRSHYPSEEYIATNGSVLYLLRLQKKFWQSVGISTAEPNDANYMWDFWQGENALEVVKNKIKMIKVSLAGTTTLIMKPVP